MTTENKIIPVFFASDDNYVPFLSVAIKSMLCNANKNYRYNVHVLTEGLSQANVDKLLTLKTENSSVIIDNVSDEIAKIKSNMNATLRDYYTESIFYRIFIGRLYNEYDKAIYLDCDVCVVDDISKMFNTDIGDNIFGAVLDGIVKNVNELVDYVENAVGVNKNEYFNSGVLLINLNEYKKERIYEKFTESMFKYNFQTIAPDQDYLNVLCKNKVYYFDEGWDKMSINENLDGKLHLIHYNMFKKPWLCDGVPYDEYFWKYAKLTPFYNDILQIKLNAPSDVEINGEKGLVKMIETSKIIIDDENNFKKVLIDNKN